MPVVLWGQRWQPFVMRVVGGGVLLVTVVGALFIFKHAFTTHQELENVRRQVAKQELALTGVPTTTKSGTARFSAAQVDALNEVVDRLNVPWAQLLGDLERLTPASVAVIQVEPRASAHSLVWQVEAKARQDVFTYLEQLKTAKLIKHARIVKFETNTQDSNRPTRFVLQAQIGDFGAENSEKNSTAVAAQRVQPSVPDGGSDESGLRLKWADATQSESRLSRSGP